MMTRRCRPDAFPRPAGSRGRSPAARPAPERSRPRRRSPARSPARPGRRGSPSTTRRPPAARRRRPASSGRESRRARAPRGGSGCRASCTDSSVMRSTSRIVNGRSTSASIIEKTAALAPRPRPSVTTTMALIAGRLQDAAAGMTHFDAEGAHEGVSRGLRGNVRRDVAGTSRGAAQRARRFRAQRAESPEASTRSRARDRERLA